MNPINPQATLHQVTPQNHSADRGESEGERRRLPRVNLPTEQFRLSSNGKVFGVADLSPSGMSLRLLNIEDRVLFSIGTKIQGFINVGQKKHSVHALVRNLRGNHVGCEFFNLEKEVSEDLTRWLDPLELGQSLRLMPTPVGFGGCALDWVWYHGRSGTEVLARVNQSIEKVVVVLWGAYFVEWCSHLGLSTGTVRFSDGQDSVQGVFYVSPEWFKADQESDSQKLDLAKSVLSYSKVPDSWKSWIINCQGASSHGS